MLIFLALLSCGTRSAQGFPHQEFLWSVANRNATVYLLGSIHALRPMDYPLAGVIDEAFNQADQVVFEVKYEELNSPFFSSYVTSRASYPRGETLQQHIAADTYQLLKAYKAETGLNLSDAFRPWYVTALIINLEVEPLGYVEALGVDRHYYDRAKAVGKPILALESAPLQIDLLADVPPAQQEKELRDTLLNRGEVGQGLSKLVAAWTSGNLAELTEIIQQEQTDNPETHARFFTDRNNRWVSQIETFLSLDQITLVIAGAGHFVGDDGVVNLLRRKGYIVQQLPLRPTRLLSPRRLDAGDAELTFELIAGHNYSLEASTNLLTWDSIWRFVSSDATKNYLDSSARGMPSRFYRLRNLDAALNLP
ncbi:MAG: TraB/GumN family protein [Verrucomicrobia bacterium]|nr:TraB/GumN family protein [Verrucomicrobiota bacterium]